MLVKIHQNIPKFLLWTLAILCILSPQNSLRQLAIAKGFAKANSVIRVITLEKILPRWLFHRKIYIQFTIIIYKQAISLARASGVSYVLQEVGSIIYFWQFIHSLFSFRWQWNKYYFHILYHCICEIL